MRILFLLLVFPFGAICAHAQIKGLIASNNERLSSATVKNINSGLQTVSDERGEFILKAKIGDTLVVLKDGFINDTILVKSQQLVIAGLRKQPLRLKEVVINGNAPSPTTLYKANRKYYKLIYFWGDNKGIFLSGSLVNIDKLNNALGKRGRQSRQLQRTFTNDYKNDVVDQRFNPLAARVTGYKGRRLEDFIENNRPTYEMIVKSSDYDIIKYIRKKMAETKKSNLIKFDFKFAC
jgi:hypothetical protein